MLVSLGLRTSRSHPRFQTMNRSVNRFDGLAQACIRADILRFGVVLNEAAQHEIGAPKVGTLQSPQTLDEVALGEVLEIIFDAGFKLYSAFWRCPLQTVLPLS